MSRLLPPLPVYEPAVNLDANTITQPTIESNIPSETTAPVTENTAPITESSPPIIETSASNNPSSRLHRELDRYFPINGDNSTASGSGTSSSVNTVNESPITERLDTTAEVPSIEVIPATPIEGSPIDNLDAPARPLSPTGSEDSSETIRPFAYGDPGERPRFALPRSPFDQNYRRNN